MKILYLVPHVPNPTKARSYSQIQGLLNARHQITVATLARTVDDLQKIDKLKQAACSVLTGKLTTQRIIQNCLFATLLRLPLQARFAWSPRLMTTINEYLQEYRPDIVHVEHLRMAQYGLKLARNWPLVWDAVDHLSSLYEQASHSSTSLAWRLISGIEAPRLRTYESKLVRTFSKTLVITTRDQQLFQDNNEEYADRITVAPFGIPIETTRHLARSPNTIVLTGTLNYDPNVASVLFFVREIFSLILEQLPQTKLQLVGANPTATILALRSQNIEVTGFVPSLSAFLSNATLAVAPAI